MTRTPVLAQLLSEAALRRIAGPAYFERGEEYFVGGAVTAVRMSRGQLTASVEGTRRYNVRFRVEGRELDWSCTCPLGQDGEACKHVVAAGLAWLAHDTAVQDTSTKDEPAVKAFLRGLSQEALVKLVLERASEDEMLAAWLLVKAQATGMRSPKAALRTIERAFQVYGDYDYHDTPAYIAQAEQAVDLLEAMLKARDFSAAADLSEYALRLGFSAMGEIDDSEGELGMTLQRIADVHARACARGGVPGLQLADRLFGLVMDDPWDAVSPEAYRKALGREGLERFREAVRREWEKLPALKPGSRAQDSSGKRYALTALMRWCAAGTRDADALVAIEQRDLAYPGAFLRIAELLKKARRHDEALQWAERGAASFPDGSMGGLRDFLAAEYQRRKQHDRALALRWEDFEKHASLASYRALESCARAARNWAAWRTRALDWLRPKAAEHSHRGNIWSAGTVLTEIHLAEGDLTAALAQARASKVHMSLWFGIAAACEAERPADASAIYLEHLERIIDGKKDRAYDEAAKLLRKISTLMRRQGQAPRFLDVLGGVQTRHKAKRNLMKRLEPIAAAARKQGPRG